MWHVFSFPRTSGHTAPQSTQFSAGIVLVDRFVLLAHLTGTAVNMPSMFLHVKILTYRTYFNMSISTIIAVASVHIAINFPYHTVCDTRDSNDKCVT